MTLCKTYSIGFQCRRKNLLQHRLVQMLKDRKAFQAKHRHLSMEASILPKMHQGPPHRRHSHPTKTPTFSMATETSPHYSKQRRAIQQRNATLVFALRSQLSLLWLDKAIFRVFLLFLRLK